MLILVDDVERADEVLLARLGELKQVEETASRTERALERSDFIRILCPNCRASYILTDEWGES